MRKHKDRLLASQQSGDFHQLKIDESDNAIFSKLDTKQLKLPDKTRKQKLLANRKKHNCSLNKLRLKPSELR